MRGKSFALRDCSFRKRSPVLRSAARSAAEPCNSGSSCAPPQPPAFLPVASEPWQRRSRRMSMLAVTSRPSRAMRTVLGVATAAMLLGGCGLPRATQLGSPAIDGLRTDPDGRGLWATYLGGACDGPARLDVDEGADRVTVRVLVAGDADEGPGASCVAVGIPRTVHADLSAPLRRRSISDGARVVVPFDGSRLLQPQGLPEGFVVTQETGGYDESSRTAGWTRSFGRPSSTELGAPCRSDPGSFSISVGGPRGEQPPFFFRRTGTVAVPGGTGRLFEQPPSVRYLYFERQGTAVSITSALDCGGDKLLTPPQLAALAQSLVPVM